MKKKYYLVMTILLLVLISIAITYYFYVSQIFGIGPFGPGSADKAEVAKSNACQMLINAGCNSSTESIEVKNFDANRNGILNDKGGIAWNQNTDCGPSEITSGDNLATLCLCYYEVKNDSDCKTQVCNCPP